MQQISVTGLNYSRLDVNIGIIDSESKEVIEISHELWHKSNVAAANKRIEKTFKIHNSYPLNYCKIQLEKVEGEGLVGLLNVSIRGAPAVFQPETAITNPLFKVDKVMTSVPSP